MHPEPLKGDEFTEKLHNIEATIIEMFTGAHICLENGDEAVALDLYAKTKEIGRTCDVFIERIIKSEQDVGLTCKNLAVFALYFRYLKRINAHLRNIVSSVINPFDRIGYKPKQS
jgi:phosphate uptake regulator